MTSRESKTRPNDETADPVPANDATDTSVERSEPHVNVLPGAQDAELHPDRPETMQHDHSDAPGRQRYADARPGDYSRDFQEDDSGSHPVKPLDESDTDEDGIPAIASRKPHEGKAD